MKKDLRSYLQGKLNSTEIEILEKSKSLDRIVIPIFEQLGQCSFAVHAWNVSLLKLPALLADLKRKYPKASIEWSSLPQGNDELSVPQIALEVRGDFPHKLTKAKPGSGVDYIDSGITEPLMKFLKPYLYVKEDGVSISRVV